MTVRKTGRWQCQLDDRILEYLQSGEWNSPTTISRELGSTASRRRVHKRCRVLAQAGLVEPMSDDSTADQFRITSWGELYLEGEVDAELIQPIPRPRPPDKVRPGEWAGFV